MVDFTKATVAATELFQLMDRTSSIDPFDETGEKPQQVPGHVEIENVTFSYPMRPTIPVLEDFSLNIPAGKVTALVGASGSGKSTIVGLLERWYSPSAGTIKLDGKPIDKLNLQWLRQHVRLVQQEPVLFSGSVYENIINGLVGTPWETDSREEKMARVQNAAKVAFAHDFISALPDGYDTVIGERGGLLSGGQKQRVAIARSIISEPRILLLDEATSALDPHAEEIVQKALSNVSQGRTTITIAHKLATIRTADNIVVMRQGKVIEQGSHETLMSQDGAYAHLVQAQDLSVKSNDESDETGSSDSGDDTDNEPSDKNVLDHSLTRYSTTTRKQMDARLVSEDFEKWKRVGFFATLQRLISMTSEMKWRYLRLLLAIFVAGKWDS
jgi:ATP-binding cassette subfamily B (MDR/TAP) protein 1